MKRLILSLTIMLGLTACGDFPDYRYERAEDSCKLSFPFAAGVIGRQYIGYLHIVSTLQYLDSDPEVEIYVGEPSHIELEVGSLQKIEINDQFFVPKFHQNYLQGEYQYYGPAFTFTKEQSAKIYQALQQGYDMTLHGRVEIGSQYETDMYNFFFEDTDEPFRNCINRLLDEKDLDTIQQKNNK
jgi:hypothetical protein